MELKYQLAKLVKTHDIVMIRRLSIGQDTEKVLSQLPKDPKIVGSDFQGGSKEKGIIIGYFPSEINGIHFEVYMSKKESFEVFPKWKLYRISVLN
ncbi:MAG: hypothetical protein ACO1OT_18730 [Heyndrickxia sp.]